MAQLVTAFGAILAGVSAGWNKKQTRIDTARSNRIKMSLTNVSLWALPSEDRWDIEKIIQEYEQGNNLNKIKIIQIYYRLKCPLNYLEIV